jgi:hypothetical protein
MSLNDKLLITPYVTFEALIFHVVTNKHKTDLLVK